jgi:hypothetical protein
LDSIRTVSQQYPALEGLAASLKILLQAKSQASARRRTWQTIDLELPDRKELG